MCWVAVDVWVILLLQHGRAPFHLSTWFQRCRMLIAVDGFCPCSWSIALLVLRTHHPTVDGRELIVTVANIWKSLPPSVTMSTAQYSFQLNSKTELSVTLYSDSCYYVTDCCFHCWVLTFFIFDVKTFGALWSNFIGSILSQTNSYTFWEFCSCRGWSLQHR